MKLKLDDHVLAEVDDDVVAYLKDWSGGDLTGLATHYTKNIIPPRRNTQLTEVKVTMEITFVRLISQVPKNSEK